ncbi:hypothetical protein BgiMline_027470 [Biomphalaria glabrata]|uniref:Mediator of RNA polymerase II transcription subunit 15 n=1 Tax=Biomphalaria glabrata TaxID=6526 RepID=A0A2C9KSA4_BIOGL|nr:mediator of RNA polymerase II transcription subunit 15 isoform X1 [Biomphalaria glabrata]
MAATESQIEDTKETEESADSDEWKAEKYRNKVIERIQDEITKSESQIPKTAAQLEEFVFSKATSRKSYLDLTASLLIYINDFNKKKEKKDSSDGDNKQEEEVTEQKDS